MSESELTNVKGIGPTRAAKLAGEAGISTLVDLARAKANDVAEVLNISLDAARALIAYAAQLVADEIPFGDGDASWPFWVVLNNAPVAPVEHLLTGVKPVK